MKDVIKDLIDKIDLDKHIEENVLSEETKDKMVKKLNEDINIPFISEKTEEKAIDAMLTIVFDVLRGVLGVKK